MNSKNIAKSISAIVVALLLVCTMSLSAFAQADYTDNVKSALGYIKTDLKSSFDLPDDDYNKSTPNIFTAFTVYGMNMQNDADYSFLIPSGLDETTVDGLMKNILLGVLSGKSEAELNAYGEKLAKLQSADGGFVNTSDTETVTSTAWAVLALENTAAKYDSEKAAAYFKANLLSDGGFNDYGAESNVDITAMAVLALNKMDGDNAKAILDSAVKFLKSTKNADSFYVGKGEYDSANSCSQAYAIMALDVATDDDLTDAINALISLQDENGGFWYDAGSKAGQDWFTAPDYMSTYESMMALTAVQNGNKWAEKAAVDDPTTKLDETTAITTTKTNNDNEAITTTANADDVATGRQPFNPIFIVILVVAVIAVVLALIPVFKKKKK